MIYFFPGMGIKRNKINTNGKQRRERGGRKVKCQVSSDFEREHASIVESKEQRACEQSRCEHFN